MIKQECIGIPDMILLLMIFCFKKIKIKAEIVLSPGGAYFKKIKIKAEIVLSPGGAYFFYANRNSANRYNYCFCIYEWNIFVYFVLIEAGLIFNILDSFFSQNFLSFPNFIRRYQHRNNGACKIYLKHR